MKIKKINISGYGKLSDLEISPSDGINVIYGKNESGKSTVADFIRYMLYGFSRTSKLEKTKYTPWTDTPAAGVMAVELDNKTKLDIERHNGSRAISHIYTAERKDVGAGESAGELYLGIDEKLYMKTAYTAQNDITANSMNGVADAVRNMVGTLDEDTDISDVKKKLSAEKNALFNKGYKTGKIFELEEKKRVLEEELSKYSAGHKELLAAEFMLNETKAKINSHKEELSKRNNLLNDLNCYKARLKLEEIKNAQSSVLKTSAEYESCVEKARCGQDLPNEEFVHNLSVSFERYKEAGLELKKAFEDFERVGKAVSDAKSENPKINAIGKEYNNAEVSYVCAEIMGGYDEIKKRIKRYTKRIILFFALIVTFPLAIYFILKVKRAKEELKAYIDRYFCQSEDEFLLLIKDLYPTYREKNKELGSEYFLCEEKYKALSDTYAEKEKELLRTVNSLVQCDKDDLTEVCGKLIKNIQDNISLLREKEAAMNSAQKVYDVFNSQYDINELESLSSAFSGVVPEKDEKALLKEIDYYDRAIKALLEREKELIKKTGVYSANLPKPGEIESEIDFVNKELEKSKMELGAIELAMSLILESCEDIKKDAAPILSEYAADIYRIFTGEKYSGLFVDTEMNLSFSQKGTDISRESFYLSTGAQDMAYIALRISLVKYMYNEKPPIIFDDAFCSLDNERLENMLEFLKKLSQDYQIFIFTCHKREAEMLGKFENARCIKIEEL